MKELESSLKNMLLILAEVAAISVVLLAYVNELTKRPIAETDTRILNETLKEALPGFTDNPVTECDAMLSEEDGKKIVDFIIYPAENGDQWVGTVVEAKSVGFSGELKILAGFDVEGKTYNYSLLSHAETPELGSRAIDWFKEGNRGSIKGMNPGEQPLTVSKDGGQVDTITASTITSCAFLNAVNAAYGAYEGNGDTNETTGASQKTTPVQESETTTVDPVVIK